MRGGATNCTPQALNKPDQGVAARRKIVKKHPEMSGRELCQLFDDSKKKIPLPSGPHWDPHRKDNYPWVSAYDDPGFDYELRQLIHMIICHDKERA